MLFILPVFQVDTYDLDSSTIHESGIALLKNIYFRGSQATYETAVDKYISETKDLDFSLIYLKIPGYPVFKQAPDYETELRLDEFTYIYVEAGGEVFEACFEQKMYTRMEGIINIGRTIFVCIVLSVGSIFFSRDADKLVL